MRCIVSNLTDDGSNELLEELVRGQASEPGVQGDSMDNWRAWMPDPVDADPGR